MIVTLNTIRKLLYAVRSYKLVGRIERYAWVITRELATLGHYVEVVREHYYADKSARIEGARMGQYL